MDLWFVLRCACYVFYGGILTGLVGRFRHLRLDDWPGFRYWLWAFFAASGYAVAESMWLRIPGGPRLVVITGTLGGLFVGCYWPWAQRQWAGRQEKRRD